jgi:DNA (cytosine-5)-methyltransferase 1
MESTGLRFIDLFAGLGGFHLAIKRLGHTCVFACESDENLRVLYEKNFGLKPEGDIRRVEVSQIPSHDILCAGFPCQPFSKAGEQQGFDCPKEGDLFRYVMRIVLHHQPTYVILENVPNLKRHNNGDTWRLLARRLTRAGYSIDSAHLSPHQFGIPQIRERVFIVGSRSPLAHFAWPTAKPDAVLSLKSSLDEKPPDARPLSPQVLKCLKVWQQFIKRFPKREELPSFPIWSMEFGATYPYEKTTPHKVGRRRLREYRGSHGKRLRPIPAGDRLKWLPSHAKTRQSKFPTWKVQFIKQNRELFERHKKWMKPWLPKILSFPPSLQKLEWNCKGETRDIWKYVIQFRASGVRVKRPTTAPSLIAMTTTQVPIVAWEKRYMTPRECARLQSMKDLPCLPDVPTRAFRALGNAVNADLVEMIAKTLLTQPAPSRPARVLVLKHSKPGAHRRTAQPLTLRRSAGD